MEAKGKASIAKVITITGKVWPRSFEPFLIAKSKLNKDVGYSINADRFRQWDLTRMLQTGYRGPPSGAYHGLPPHRPDARADLRVSYD